MLTLALTRSLYLGADGDRTTVIKDYQHPFNRLLFYALIFKYRMQTIYKLFPCINCILILCRIIHWWRCSHSVYVDLVGSKSFFTNSHYSQAYCRSLIMTKLIRTLILALLLFSCEQFTDRTDSDPLREGNKSTILSTNTVKLSKIIDISSYKPIHAKFKYIFIDNSVSYK